MKLLQVDTITEAREKMLDVFRGRKLKTQLLNYQEVYGLVLAEDIFAGEDIPGFDRSTVDGYAVQAADTAGAGESIPVFLRIAGQVEMGQPSEFTVGSGECVYVPTGGMIPDGADAVVMVEYCEPFENSSLAVYGTIAPGGNLIRRGDDAQAGQMLLRCGTLMRAQEIGVLAAAGITEVSVYKPLVISIISTGDELVPPTQKPKLGEVRDLNSAALKARAAQAGFSVLSAQVVKDDEEQITGALKSVLPGSDIVVISGGSSQGEKDMTARIIEKVSGSELLTHGLAVKPGKPTIIGYDKKSGSLLLGLPGHPVSAMLVFEVLLAWLWRALSGQRHPYPIEALMAHNIPGDPGKDTLQLVRLEEESGQVFAVPVLGKSGLITRLSQADGYCVIDRNKEGIAKGEHVKVYTWRV